MIRKNLFIVIIFILAVNAGVYAQNAQNAQELRVGTFINGSLKGGNEITYIVRPAQAGFLTVETSGSLDTFLEAYDDQQRIIAKNDDGGEGYNAKVDIVVAAGRVYYFVLSGYDEDTSGPFRIIASIRPMPSPTPIRANVQQSGTINRGEDQWFSFRAEQNGYLVVETTGGTDTYLEAFDQSWILLAEDDDGGSDNNARIELIAGRGKTFNFRLRGYDNATSGPFNITASIRNLPAPTTLTTGTFHSGNIASGEDYWFRVQTGSRGRLIVETSGSTDTYLEVYNDSYELLDSDDDGGEGGNARIEVSAERNRVFIFRLRGFSSTTSGPYRLFASME